MGTRSSNELRQFGRVTTASLFLGEHVMLLLALALLVPAVPSEAGQVFHFRRTAMLIAGAVIVSRLLAICRGKDSWAGLVVKTLCFLLAGWVMYLRVGFQW